MRSAEPYDKASRWPLMRQTWASVVGPPVSDVQQIIDQLPKRDLAVLAHDPATQQMIRRIRSLEDPAGDETPDDDSPTP